jgi:alkylation response protein AidB-like acyl-CoA dehydrogenase
MVIPIGEGVELTQMKMSGGSASGTTFVNFDNAKVPRENVIGKEGQGVSVVPVVKSLTLTLGPSIASLHLLQLQPRVSD